MDAAVTLARARAAGLVVQLSGSTLLVGPKGRITPELRQELRDGKPGLVELLATEQAPGLAEALAGAIRHCCAVRGDSPENQADLLAECAALPPESQADLLAHFVVEAARWPGPPPGAVDDRATCHGCAHYRPGRCLNYRSAGLSTPTVGADLARLPQRCPRRAPRGLA